MGIDTGLDTGPGPLSKPLPTSFVVVPVLLLSCWLSQRLERETGIEPASLAWKARVLPLNYSRLEPGTAFVHLVEEAGFEPAYALAGRFTVCCL